MPENDLVYARSFFLLSPETTGLLIVDLQERLLPVIAGNEGILKRAIRLGRAAGRDRRGRGGVGRCGLCRLFRLCGIRSAAHADKKNRKKEYNNKEGMAVMLFHDMPAQFKK